MTTMSKQEALKQTHELGCLKAAQCLAGFPQGKARPGDNPPDCYVTVPDRGDVAVELTEQIDEVAVYAADLAKRLFADAEEELFHIHPELRMGWRIYVDPGDVFEIIAAEPRANDVYKRQRDGLIDRVVAAVAGEAAEQHRFTWRVSGEPIWTITCERVCPNDLTQMDVLHRAWHYDYSSRDRVENEIGRDVTFKPEKIQERIKDKADKVSVLQRYKCRPAYLLISASLFPRPTQNGGSFAVLKTPASIVDHSFDIGGFTAVFLHDAYSRSYRIGKDGRAVECRALRCKPMSTFG